MKQAQTGFVNSKDRLPVGVDTGGLPETQFFDLQIPVAEVMPDEVPERLRGFVVAVRFQSTADYFASVFEAVKNPDVLMGLGVVGQLSEVRRPAVYMRPLH